MKQPTAFFLITILVILCSCDTNKSAPVASTSGAKTTYGKAVESAKHLKSNQEDRDEDIKKQADDLLGE